MRGTPPATLAVMKNGLIKIAVSLLVGSATILPAASAAADVVFATVDAIELPASPNLRITGIVEGSTVPTTDYYRLNNLERCERFAMLAMSKPGKYRLTLVYMGSSYYNCKLSLRAP
jgi:hypothetical protein